MGNKSLTFEELGTLFCQIENVLNSRPIGVVSEDPKDSEILTPAHLVCGGKLEVFPTVQTSTNVDLTKCSVGARWNCIQNLLLHF